MITNEYLQQTMDQIEALVGQFQEPTFDALCRFLKERVEAPESFVVMLGETSSGKTTLVNGLLQKHLFKTSASPTTGTVIEIMDDPGSTGEEFYRVNRNATIEELSLDRFAALSQHPEQEPDLLRLRVLVPEFPYNLKAMRLFDTPGYGSLYKEHEEILKNFIPNSDIIVYVVSYRVGFKDNDHQFMQFIQTILQEDSEFFLVVNRAPQEASLHDRRIQEILQHAEDSLHRKLHCLIVPAVNQANDDSSATLALPAAAPLWERMQTVLQAPKRLQAVRNALARYQQDLLLSMTLHAEKELAFARASAEEQQWLQDELAQFLGQEQQIHVLIDNTFSRLASQLPRLFEYACERMHEEIRVQIEETNKWTDQDECVNFIQAHSMPLQVRRETKEMAHFLQEELERLDEETHSLLNTAVRKFEREVIVKTAIFEPLLLNIGSKMAQKAAGYGLLQFFAQFGGAGGAGAGVANFAKKALKGVGKLVGTTFSRDTHNALASFLKNIGATSTRAVTSAAYVLVQGAFYLYDAMTWQNKLLSQVKEALQTWKSEALAQVLADLENLKEHNHKNFQSFFAGYQEAFATPETNATDDLDRMERLRERVSFLISDLATELSEEEPENEH